MTRWSRRAPRPWTQLTTTRAAAALTGICRATAARRKTRPLPVPRETVAPTNRLTCPERAHVLAVLNSDEFVAAAPIQVYATLLDRGVYLCSIFTMYRTLAENSQVKEREVSQHPRADPVVDQTRGAPRLHRVCGEVGTFPVLVGGRPHAEVEGAGVVGDELGLAHRGHVIETGARYLAGQERLSCALHHLSHDALLLARGEADGHPDGELQLDQAHEVAHGRHRASGLDQPLGQDPPGQRPVDADVGLTGLRGRRDLPPGRPRCARRSGPARHTPPGGCADAPARGWRAR